MTTIPARQSVAWKKGTVANMSWSQKVIVQDIVFNDSGSAFYLYHCIDCNERRHTKLDVYPRCAPCHEVHNNTIREK